MSSRTAMLDLHVDPSLMENNEKFSEFIKKIENVLKTLALKLNHQVVLPGNKKSLFFVSETSAFTCLLTGYPNGVVTLTFEESLDQPWTNSEIDDLRKQLRDELNVRVIRIPLVKRGEKVPIFFTSSDERIQEYDFDKLVYEVDSPYQNIKILHSITMGNCLFLDDLQNLGEADISYTQGLMKFGIHSYKDKEILILGGGDGGLLWELLKEKPKSVIMVEIDQMVMDACKVHLRSVCGDCLDKLKGDNYEIIPDDCIKYLEKYIADGKKFDFIFNDLTDIPIATSPQGELWQFVEKILGMSLQILKDDGRYLNHAVGPGAVEALQTYEELLNRLKLSFSKHSAYVPSFMEDWVFYDIWKPKES